MIRHSQETTGFSLSSSKMENDMDAKTIQTIESILKRGNDAKVRRKGGGYVVIEIKETIKSSPSPIVAREGQ